MTDDERDIGENYIWRRQWAVEQAIVLLRGRDSLTPQDVFEVANMFLDFVIPRWKPVETPDA